MDRQPNYNVLVFLLQWKAYNSAYNSECLIMQWQQGKGDEIFFIIFVADGVLYTTHVANSGRQLLVLFAPSSAMTECMCEMPFKRGACTTSQHQFLLLHNKQRIRVDVFYLGIPKS